MAGKIIMKFAFKTRFPSSWLLLLVLLACATMPAYAGPLNITYEQVVRDSWGNEIGYRKVRINSPSDLPAGSPWHKFLNTRLPEGKTVYEYSRDIAPYLSQPFNLNLSDRASTAYTSKDRSGYNLCLFDYINNFASDSSKTFLYLHEFGHVAMLNGYPSNYTFSGLDYGPDNKHYLDEILPNDNTAWVEGWANAFAADKNNGMVFSFNLKTVDSLAFLKNNSFNEMARNELFVAKVLYDSFDNSNILNGKSKVFNAISKTGPHYSLRDFSRKYLALYPEDRLALAKILVENSHGRISLNEILDYVNNGSRTVSRDLYNYMAQVGLVVPTAGTTGQPANNTPTGTTATNTGSTSTSFWGRISSWFSGLFNRAQSPVAPSPTASVEYDATPSSGVSSSVPAGGATAPEYPGTQSADLSGVNDLAQAQELYYKTFADYNRLMTGSNTNRQLIMDARNKMLAAKERVRQLRRELRK